MKNTVRLTILTVLGLLLLSFGISTKPVKVAAQNSSHDPTWWSKYEFIRDNGGDASPLSTSSASVRLRPMPATLPRIRAMSASAGADSKPTFARRATSSSTSKPMLCRVPL